MDCFKTLLVIPIMLIILNICDITAHNDELWSRKREHVSRVTDSTCGQSHAVRNEIFFLYDGSPISDPCIITIINNDLSRHSRTCIKLDNVFIYDDSFECRDVFRFYCGDYPPKNITKYLSCSDIRHEVCDADKTAYAVFSPQSTPDANIKIQIKVSTRTEQSKRSKARMSDTDRLVSNSLDSRSPRSSWSSWDSWSPSRRSLTSWSPRRRRTWTSWTTTTMLSRYSNERENAENKKEGVKIGTIIMIIIVSAVGGILCYVVFWMLKYYLCAGNDQPVQTPPVESHENENDAPPPAYSSLFPSKEK